MRKALEIKHSKPTSPQTSWNEKRAVRLKFQYPFRWDMYRSETMAPRAYWNGLLKLSLVSCPIALYPASTSSAKTHFHQINTKTGNRLRQQMVDSSTGRVVEREEKGRGYEIAKGKYVKIEPEELEAIQVEGTRTIEIDDFVPKEDIDERYLDKPYYIAPDGKAGADAFAVIRDAMKRKDKVALAHIVLSNREHIIALKPLGKGLLGTTLRYPYELRDEKEYFEDIPTPRVSKDMIDLAAHILDSKAAAFDPTKFKDTYEDALKALVKRKAAGKTIERPKAEKPADNVIDLMDALKRSLGKGSSSKASAGKGHAGKSGKAAKAKAAPSHARHASHAKRTTRSPRKARRAA
jgi:DNA end-binding protein Ku